MCDYSNPTSKKDWLKEGKGHRAGQFHDESERGTAPSLFLRVFRFDGYRLGIRNRLQLSIPPEASGRVSIPVWDDGKWNY